MFCEEFLPVNIDTVARETIASFHTCHACSEDMGVEDEEEDMDVMVNIIENTIPEALSTEVMQQFSKGIFL